LSQEYKYKCLHDGDDDDDDDDDDNDNSDSFIMTLLPLFVRRKLLLVLYTNAVPRDD